jgi:UDP-N-acetylglucosamine 2-epimerase (non-hydrolysing)
MKNPIALIIGTRPEGIKMIPVYHAFKKAGIPVVLCSTAQHQHLLDEIFSLFDVYPDFQLGVGKAHQDLFHITANGLLAIQQFIRDINPSWIGVQGDTTTAFAAALAAFYESIPVIHVEAGLRTPTIKLPFPEEFNRRAIDMLAKIHCAPHDDAVNRLCEERIEQSAIVKTGNTVVDALHLIKSKIEDGSICPSPTLVDAIQKKQYRQSVLITTHRRESFGRGIRAILQTVKNMAIAFPDIRFFYPYHPNPNVLEALKEIDLASVENILLSAPLAYQDLVYLLLNVDWVATDSGGIIEEAVTLCKPVLIMRNETERMEAVDAGAAQLVGTDAPTIFAAMQKLARGESSFKQVPHLYGDGDAAQKIIQAFLRVENQHLQRRQPLVTTAATAF